MASAKIKADQLLATGADYVVTSCHNCVDGLQDLIKHYKIPMKVTQLVNLVANALVVETTTEKPAPAVAQAAALAGFKILVVDDEPDVRDFISVVLEDNGATVLTAAGGDQGIEMARREKPDLMTLDLSMPDTDGGKVYETMRTDPELKSVKVCIVTGRPELRKLIYDRDIQRPEGYLDKPISEEGLLVSVRKILELAQEKK